MHSARSTDSFGREVITWTLPSDHTVIATVTNSRDGLDHKGAGQVEVFASDKHRAFLKFDHPYATGAASELATALQNAWGTGQQSGLRAATEMPEPIVKYPPKTTDRPEDPTIAGIREATTGNGPYVMEVSEYDPYGGQKHRYYEGN